MSTAKYDKIYEVLQKTWPFYAKTLFAKMGAVEEDTVDKVKENDAQESDDLLLKLHFLRDLGFTNRDRNVEALKKHKLNLEQSVDYLRNAAMKN